MFGYDHFKTFPQGLDGVLALILVLSKAHPQQ
jgi:hypothetical protein